MPACVYNNTKGDDDERILKEFEEPAWNNPVVHFIDRKRKDVADIIDRQWTVAALAHGMVTALRETKKPVPSWLEALRTAERSAARGVDTAIFGMA